jgi:hypothetical protein
MVTLLIHPTPRWSHPVPNQGTKFDGVNITVKPEQEPEQLKGMGI